MFLQWICLVLSIWILRYNLYIKMSLVDVFENVVLVFDYRFRFFLDVFIFMYVLSIDLYKFLWLCLFDFV